MPPLPMTEVCPVCKNDNYLTPNLEFLVSPCYHKMCVSCVNRIFSQGAAPCPICQTSLRKMNFNSQTFEDLVVEKECRIRKMISKYLNLREEDFNSASEYNNYLEEIEDITFNLLNEVDIEKTNKRIEEFKISHIELISRNEEKMLNDQRNLDLEIEEQAKQKEQSKLIAEKHLKDEIESKARKRLQVIDALATEEGSAESIVRQKIEKSESEVKSLDFLVKKYAKRPRLQEEDLFDPFETCVSVPQISLLETYFDPPTLKFENDAKCRAGGFTRNLIFLRALESARAYIQ